MCCSNNDGCYITYEYLALELCNIKLFEIITLMPSNWFLIWATLSNLFLMARELIGFEFMIVFIECIGSPIGEIIILLELLCKNLKEYKAQLNIQ